MCWPPNHPPMLIKQYCWDQKLESAYVLWITLHGKWDSKSSRCLTFRKSNTKGIDYFQVDTFLSFIGKQIKNDQIISITIEDNTYYIRLLSQLKGRKQLSAKLRNGKSKSSNKMYPWKWLSFDQKRVRPFPWIYSLVAKNRML